MATFYELKRANIVSIKFLSRFFLFWAQNLENNLTKAPTRVNVMDNFSPLYSSAVEPCRVIASYDLELFWRLS
jgi:hypothetical protein